MEVEYLIGVTNRYAYLYDKVEVEDEAPPSTTSTTSTKAKGPSNNAAASDVKSTKHMARTDGKFASVDKNKTEQATRGKDKPSLRTKKSDTSEDKKFNGPAPDLSRKGIESGQERGVPRRGFQGRPNEGRPYHDRRRPIGDDGAAKTNEIRGKRSPLRGNTKGTVKEDKENETEKPQDDSSDAVENSKPIKEDVVDGNEDTEAAETEEQKITLTLAEWKALQIHREKPAYNIRKPGEGEGSLSKLVPKKKEDDDFKKDEVLYEVEEVYYPQRAGKLKVISDVGFTTGYQRKPRGRGFEGSREGRRGFGRGSQYDREDSGKRYAKVDEKGDSGRTSGIQEEEEGNKMPQEEVSEEAPKMPIDRPARSRPMYRPHRVFRAPKIDIENTQDFPSLA